MSDITAIKAAIDTAITNKTAVHSITPSILGARMKATADELRPYEVYTALLNQTGTSAPLATILENTVGAIVWTRTDVGQYEATLANAFLDGKAWCIASTTNGGNLVKFYRANDSALIMLTYDSSNVISDEVLINHSIEIRAYP